MRITGTTTTLIGTGDYSKALYRYKNKYASPLFIDGLIKEAKCIMDDMICKAGAPLDIVSTGEIYKPYECTEDEEEAIRKFYKLFGYEDPWSYCFRRAYRTRKRWNG